jgi:transcriptional regulator with XRE-family HTH domain
MTEDPQRPRGGEALKVAIHVARERAGITSDMELARRAGVSYDTLMNWFGDRTMPRPTEMKRVGDAIGVRLVELMDVWEGRDPEPPGLLEAVGVLTDEIRLLLVELRMGRAHQEESTSAILRALAAAARGGLAPRETPERTERGAGAGSRRS